MEERISEEDNENTNNLSTSYVIATPNSNTYRRSVSANKSQLFEESLNISDNMFGSREILQENTALTINFDDNLSTYDSKQLEEEARQEAIFVRRESLRKLKESSEQSSPISPQNSLELSFKMQIEQVTNDSTER